MNTMTGYVYILQSDSGMYYIGSTNNLDRRIDEHLRGKTHTTSRMKNIKLVFSQEFPSLIIARQIERKIKSWKRKDFIDKIVRDGYIKVSI